MSPLWFSISILTSFLGCRTLGMSMAWLQCLWCSRLIPLWLLPSLVLPRSRGGGIHSFLLGRPPLLFQSQPPQSPGLQLQLDPAAPLLSEPHEGQRGAGDRAGRGGSRVTLQLPEYLIPCEVYTWSTSDLKQCTTKGNTVIFDQWDGCSSEPGHITEQQSNWQCWQGTWPSSVAIKHHQ